MTYHPSSLSVTFWCVEVTFWFADSRVHEPAEKAKAPLEYGNCGAESDLQKRINTVAKVPFSKHFLLIHLRRDTDRPERGTRSEFGTLRQEGQSSSPQSYSNAAAYRATITFCLMHFSPATNSIR